MSDRIEFSIVKRPLIKGLLDFECGDDAIVKKFGAKVFLAVIDALGHGGDAHAISIICKNFIEKRHNKKLSQTVTALHENIKSLNKGAVACLAVLDLDTGELEYVSVGNICLKIFGSVNRKIEYKPGIIGYNIPTPQVEFIKMSMGDVLVMHTDGVKEHFDITDFPDIMKNSAEKIAKKIIRKFGKEQDDACCLVLRYIK